MKVEMQIAIIGGRSRSAGALVRHVLRDRPDISLRSFVRADGPALGVEGGEEVVIGDYGLIDAAALRGCEAVINFVGIAQGGDREKMLAVNKALAERLAQEARAAGARQFLHLSSLAVHPAVPLIQANTPIAPTSCYGISKAEAERALAQLDGQEFVVTVLRLPTMYGPRSVSKMSSLGRLYSRLPVFPAPRQPPRRSVISYENLSRVLLALLADRRAGTIYAADPEPFTFEMLAQIFPRTRRLPLPALALAALRTIAPEISRSLYESAEIDPTLLYRPEGEPLLPTAQVLREALTNLGSE